MEYIYYNPNPNQRYRADGRPIKSDQSGDCVVRAVAKALDLSWEDSYKKLCEEGLRQHIMPNDSSGKVYGKVLENAGFKLGNVNQDFIRRYHRRPTVSDLYDSIERNNDISHKKIVVKNTHHLTCIDEGVIFDTWDTSDECVWKFWYK